MKQAILLLSLLLLPGGTALDAQGAQGPEALGLSEWIDVRAVNVEAVVTDSKGRRVKDLKAEDFRLLVDGREARIDSFSEVREGQTEPAAPAISAALTASATSAALTTSAGAPTSASSTASAGVAPGERVGTSYLVFIENHFALESERNATLWTLKRDLALLGPGDRMAIVTYDGRGLTRLAGWTADVAVLQEAFAAAARQESRGLVGLVAARSDERADAWLAEQSLFGSAGSGIARRAAVLDSVGSDRDLLGLKAVERIWGRPRVSDRDAGDVRKIATAAALTLRGMPVPEGRRVMMVLAGDWPWDEDPESLRPLTTAANLLGYTLYPVSVTGLKSLFYNADASLDTTSTSASAEDMIWTPIQPSSQRSSDGALRALAQATGGVVAFNRDHSLSQVAADTRSYYRLGFSPIWKADDQPHDIRVEVRRPNLTARARGGFFDLSHATNSALTAEGVLSLGGDPARKRLAVTAGAPRPSGRDAIELPVTFTIPAELLARLPGAAPGYTLEGSLAVAALDAAGGRISLPGQILRGTLPEAPRPGVFVRIRTVLHLRRAQQRLVFTVTGKEESPIWTELEVKP